eukprot:8775633-Alexandrium_andersonii.AAC.1
MLLADCAAREPQTEQAAAAATKGVHTPAVSVTNETETIRACWSRPRLRSTSSKACQVEPVERRPMSKTAGTAA